MVTVTRIDSITPYKRGTKVIATRDLQGVPEGTRGKVKLVNGTVWARYWVEFENGVWLGSIDHASLVVAGEWDAYRRRRAEEAEKAESAPEETDATLDEAAPAGDDAASKVPAHLLERSRKAKERAAAKSAG